MQDGGRAGASSGASRPGGEGLLDDIEDLDEAAVWELIRKKEEEERLAKEHEEREKKRKEDENPEKVRCCSRR